MLLGDRPHRDGGLGKLIKHSEYSIMLTDRDGVILSYVGDTGFSATARRSGFREGVMWSEREMGTNGMGTCLTTRPLGGHPSHRSFSRAEHRAHLLARRRSSTCAASCSRRSTSPAASSNPQSHTLALVEMAAQNVENRTLLQRLQGPAPGALPPLRGVRQHARARACWRSMTRGVIKGVNRAALKLLGQRDHESVCGQRVEQVLDTSLATLMQLAAQRGYRAEALSPQGLAAALVRDRARTGGCAAAHTGAGQSAARHGAALEARGSLDCLHSTDPAMMHNVEMLRRVIDRDISVLLLGETGTGKGYLRARHS